MFQNFSEQERGQSLKNVTPFNSAGDPCFKFFYFHNCWNLLLVPLRDEPSHIFQTDIP